jgi:hypothetical protein
MSSSSEDRGCLSRKFSTRMGKHRETNRRRRRLKITDTLALSLASLEIFESKGRASSAVDSIEEPQVTHDESQEAQQPQVTHYGNSKLLLWFTTKKKPPSESSRISLHLSAPYKSQERKKEGNELEHFFVASWRNGRVSARSS